MSRAELLSVFSACNPDENGEISLTELANISRSHVDSSQAENLLQIFNSNNQKQDHVNFDQFCFQVQNYMKKNQMKGAGENYEDEQVGRGEGGLEGTGEGPLEGTEEGGLEGTGEEEGRRGGERATEGDEEGTGGSPVESKKEKELGDRLNSPRKRLKQKGSKTKRNSQTRLTGQIPLVNTSSEDDIDLEDSFDRQIAASLEFAGKQLEHQKKVPRYLVRGSNIRSTLRSKSSASLLTTHQLNSQKVELSPISHASEDIIFPEECSYIRKGDQIDYNDDGDMEHFSTPSASQNPSRHSSPILGEDSAQPRSMLTRVVEGREDIHNTRSVLEGLERKLESLSNQQNKENINNSQLGDIKDDYETELEKWKRHSNERMEHQVLKHREEMVGIAKERELERINFQLRLDQLQEDNSRLKKEKTDLNEKVRLLYIEKEMAEEVSRMSMDSDRTNDGSTRSTPAESFDAEYLIKIQQLLSKLEHQDDQIAELKEDNKILRSQKKQLAEIAKEEKTKFNFLGKSPMRRGGTQDSPLGLLVDDPQDIRVRFQCLHNQLNEQKAINKHQQAYLDDVLFNVMVKAPEILEK